MFIVNEEMSSEIEKARVSYDKMSPRDPGIIYRIIARWDRRRQVMDVGEPNALLLILTVEDGDERELCVEFDEYFDRTLLEKAAFHGALMAEDVLEGFRAGVERFVAAQATLVVSFDLRAGVPVFTLRLGSYAAEGRASIKDADHLYAMLSEEDVFTALDLSGEDSLAGSSGRPN